MQDVPRPDEPRGYKAFILDNRGVIRIESPAAPAVKGTLERMLHATAWILKEKYGGQDLEPYQREGMGIIADVQGGTLGAGYIDIPGVTVPDE
jgi:hypothetical protein